MDSVRRRLTSTLDRIIEFNGSTALEAAYLEERLRSQDVSLDPIDLLNLATAHTEGATFVTHNKDDFAREPVREIAEVDVVLTE